MLLKVKDNPHLARDVLSKAIINTDGEELTKYKRKREEKRKLFLMQSEHEQMKNDISEIKFLLQKLLEK